MTLFEQLKKQRGTGIQAIQDAADDSQNKYKDDRFWSPTVDKAGNGFAVIRFLPDPDFKQWVTYYEHGFQGPTGKWYIEKSRTSLDNQPDPVSEMNTRLWNTGRDEDKQLARDRKRKLNNVSNIMVVNDPDNPENNGKVFLFRYGVKIKDKIMAAANPQYQDETPFDPFDLWEGANLKIKIANVAGYRNYDRSEWETPGPLGDETQMEEIFKQTHKLFEFIDPANYKSYNDLKARLNDVLGEGEGERDYENDDVPYDTPSQDTAPAPEPGPVAEPDPTPTAEDSGEDEDQKAIDYFKQMTAKK